MILTRFLAIAAILFATGCASTQQVTVAKATYNKKIVTTAQVVDEGNSAPMNGHLSSALQKEGVAVTSTLPAGSKTASGVDALVSYVDVWRWDLVMYMKDLTVRMHDAETGDLLALGQWADSQPHGFRDPKVVMDGVVAEMLTKLRATKKADAPK